MSFLKLVQTGEYLEVYSYAYEPSTLGRRSIADVVRDTLVARAYSDQKVVEFIRPTKRLERSSNRARRSFLRLVRANLFGSAPALLTLTMREVVPLAQAYKEYTRFGLSLRKQFGSSFKFIGVPEWQKRGAVHFHILVWGLPEEMICLQQKPHVCPKERKCERNTRLLAKKWRMGFLDLAPTDGSPKLAGYLAKYMSKSMSDYRLAGQKSYTSSRNCLRPVSFSSLSNPAAVDFLLEDYGIKDVRSHPAIREYVFETSWLGQGTYKLFSRGSLEPL